LHKYCHFLTWSKAMQDRNPTQQRRLRGFAAMSPEKKREIAGMGGRAAHATGRAHQFTTEEARAAGRKRHQRDDSAPGNPISSATVAAVFTREGVGKGAELV
jgi:hypothetical protein